MATRVSRNSPCPCGSGKKYKYCCGRKGAAPKHRFWQPLGIGLLLSAVLVATAVVYVRMGQKAPPPPVSTSPPVPQPTTSVTPPQKYRAKPGSLPQLKPLPNDAEKLKPEEVPPEVQRRIDSLRAAEAAEKPLDPATK